MHFAKTIQSQEPDWDRQNHFNLKEKIIFCTFWLSQSVLFLFCVSKIYLLHNAQYIHPISVTLTVSKSCTLEQQHDVMAETARRKCSNWYSSWERPRVGFSWWRKLRPAQLFDHHGLHHTAFGTYANINTVDWTHSIQYIPSCWLGENSCCSILPNFVAGLDFFRTALHSVQFSAAGFFSGFITESSQGT